MASLEFLVTSLIVVTAFLMNVLNPKLTLLFLAFLPQFIARLGRRSRWGSCCCCCC